jgi:hypothetical protein
VSRLEDVAFDALGYAETAIASYRVFARLKRDGVIPAHCRFQVCLPTPLAPVSAFVAPEFQAELETVYEAALLDELAQILAAVPADQLAVQWDARAEFAILEGFSAAWFNDVRGGVLERCCGSPAMSRPKSSLASTSATEMRRTVTSSRSRTPASWSRSPTRWPRACSGRSTGCTCRRHTSRPRSTSRRSTRWRCSRRPSSTSAAAPRRHG